MRRHPGAAPMGLLLLGMLASATAGLGGEAPRESVEALRRYISRRAYKTLLARANRGGGKSAADIFLETASQSNTALSMAQGLGGGSGSGPWMIPGDKDCFGVKSEMCKPNPSPEHNEGDVIKKTCDNLLCNPICLAIGLKCEITGGSGEFAAAGEHPVSTGLCGQFIAQACVDWKCCKEDSDELTTWVEEKTFSDAYPTVGMQLPVCRHDPVDEEASKALCSDCKASGVSASFSLNADGCKFGEGPVPSSGTGRRLLGYLRARKDVKAMGLLPAAMSHDRWRRRQQGRGGSLLEVGSALPNENGFPGIGTMKSFREMCEKVVGSMSPGAPQGEATAAKLCECMGCCDPGKDGDGYCMFPFYNQDGDPSSGS